MKLSVVIPCCNLGAWLEPCLESLSGQSQPKADWEVVLVDDGSTDDTGTRAEAWKDRLQNLSVYHIPNGGVNAARKFGFEKSVGDAIWFVDGDDVLASNAIEGVLKALERGVDMAWVGEAFGEKIVFDQVALKIEVLDCSQFSRISRIVMHQCVFRRELIESVPFENYIVGEDILFASKALVKAKRVAVVDIPLYGYVTRPDSVINAARNFRKTSHAIAFTRELVRFYAEEGAALNPRGIRQTRTQFYYRLPYEIVHFKGDEFRLLQAEWCAATGCGRLRFYWGAMVFALYLTSHGRSV